MIALVFLVGCGLLTAAHFLYGGFLNRQFGIDERRDTPARTMADGVDYVSTRGPVLFGHHFSSIAGAGPIVGPIIAASAFGWGPTLAWILIGAIFIGGVHDFGSLVMSIRHSARSVAETCRLYLSPLTYRFFLVFIWLALVYVLIVFLDMTAGSFVTTTAADPDQGGTVAMASVSYIVLALIFGMMIRFGWIGLGKGTLIFVPLVFAALALAHWLPTNPEFIRKLAPAGSWFYDHPKYIWSVLLLIYCFLASVTPVWLLLQPRDYLSSYLLFGCVAFGGLGLLLSSLLGRVMVQYDAFITFHSESAGYLFPALFITVACGAVSGFHSIVASGTTAKQLPSERTARPIAYGAMLTEGALAMIALATVMMLASKPAGNPMVTFSHGMGEFLAVLGVSREWGMVFGLLAVSTFLLTTLDTCTRLARYIFEEFLGVGGGGWRYLTTLASLGPLFFFAFKEYPGPGGQMVPAWQMVWPAFGTTNQLLAALALLVVTVWRRAIGRSVWFIAWPMAFMIITTCTSMVMLISQHLLHEGGVPAIGWINAVMLAMTLWLVGDTALNWKRLGRIAHDGAAAGSGGAVAAEAPAG